MERENFFYSKFFDQNQKLANISLKINFLNQIPRHLFEFVAILIVIIIFVLLSRSNIQFSETFFYISLILSCSF